MLSKSLEYKLKKIKESVRKKPILFIITFFLFIGITSILNKTYITFSNFFSAFKLSYYLPFFFLNIIIIPLLVSTALVLSIERINQAAKISNKKGFFGVTGTIFGILGGACPGCFIGLFPAILGIFGVTASIGNLPLYGFELGIVSIIFLFIAINYLSKENVCKIKN